MSRATGTGLRVELPAPATIHWPVDRWSTTRRSATTDTGIGMHIADLETAGPTAGDEAIFTMEWQDRWEGRDYRVQIGDQEP